MKMKPILFSTPMVKALLDGSKTMTRRVIKLRDGSNPDDEDISTHIDGSFDKVMDFSKSYPQWQELKCPYGQVGDVLYVREMFYDYGKWLKNGITKSKKQKFKFKSTLKDFGGHYLYFDSVPEKIETGHKDTEGWYKRNSLFMPKEAARLFLKITNVRVERLQDITERDVKAEGAGSEVRQMWLFGTDQEGRNKIYRQSFQTLWQSINGLESWNMNPWVWVVEFKRIEKPQL